MKTAISIDDGLLQEADETARLMGLSRSRLFALAVGDFLQRQRREQMLLRLNEVYAEGMEPAETAPLKGIDRKSTRLNSSHLDISYAVFCLKKKKYSMILPGVIASGKSRNRTTNPPSLSSFNLAAYVIFFFNRPAAHPILPSSPTALLSY